MPVFKWEYDWRDCKYQPASQPASPSENSPDAGANKEAHLPVLSGYFWFYLAISVSLSFITIEVWWRVVSRTDDASVMAVKAQDSRPHWTL
jgi:hypothetical protein